MTEKEVRGKKEWAEGRKEGEVNNGQITMEELVNILQHPFYIQLTKAFSTP